MSYMDSNKTVSITIRITPEQAEEIRAEAKVSKLIREALSDIANPF